MILTWTWSRILIVSWSIFLDLSVGTCFVILILESWILTLLVLVILNLEIFEVEKVSDYENSCS